MRRDPISRVKHDRDPTRRETFVWCVFWFCANLCITLFNKWCLSGLDISPLQNTLAHMSMTFVGCFIVQRGKFPSLTYDETKRMVMFSALFTFNIVFSQVGMKMTTLSLNQVTRAITPLFQASLEYLLMSRVHSTYNLIPLIPVCLGIMMTSLGDLEVTRLGFLVSLFSVVVSALKGVLSMKILQQDLKEKLQQYTFLIVVTPLAVCWLLLWEGFTMVSSAVLYTQPVVGADDDGFDDEVANRRLLSVDSESQMKGPLGSNIATYLFVGGCFAFAVNVASIGTVKITSATTMGVMANLKQAVTMMLAVYLMEGNPTMLKMSGILVTICGAAWYTYRKMNPQVPATASAKYSPVAVIQDEKDSEEIEMHRTSHRT